jgi:hypothetical protein
MISKKINRIWGEARISKNFFNSVDQFIGLCEVGDQKPCVLITIGGSQTILTRAKPLIVQSIGRCASHRIAPSAWLSQSPSNTLHFITS